MATLERIQPNGHLQPRQQNVLFRPHSPSSPQVLSRPTASRRKASSSPSELKKGEMNTLPSQFVVRHSQQYSMNNGMKTRPIHSMYSASQPHLNVGGFDVKLRSRSHTVDSYEQRNRWSVTGIGENPDDSFKSGSIGKGYDLSLTKCSVEDLRPLPVRVVAPKVPPRRGSRLTTVPSQNYQENVKVEAQDRRYRETRSCEDLLESVSASELKQASLSQSKVNGDCRVDQHPQQYDHATKNTNHWYHSQSQLSQVGTSNVMMHGMEPQQRNQSSVQNIFSHNSKESETLQESGLLAIPDRSHAGGDTSSNETENVKTVSNYARQPLSASSQWTPSELQRSAPLVSQQVTNGNMDYTAQQAHHSNPLTERGVNAGISTVNIEPTASDGEGHYQRSISETLPHSILANEYQNAQGNVYIPGSVYSSDIGHSSVISQQHSPPPPVNIVNDANLTTTPHTSCSSPSPSPRAYTNNTTAPLMGIPQNHEPYKDNNLTAAPGVPHYAISTNPSSGKTHIQEQAANANNSSVQVVQDGPHSYRSEPDSALKVSTPSKSEFCHTQSQDMDHKHKSQVAMAKQGDSTQTTSLSQPPISSSKIQTLHKSSVEAQTHSQGVSQQTESLVHVFNQWQYHGVPKRKQGSNKHGNRSESKPPIKPKPVSLLKGGNASLKTDKSKSRKAAEGHTIGKKSGPKYVFKQSQSRTLLSRGRTPSQVDPLTDVGMETHYDTYTPQKHHQSSSASSGDSTLKDELTFSDTPNAIAIEKSGPSPNSYDYGSQMTITGDATLTPCTPGNGFHSPTSSLGYRVGLAQPAVQSISGANTVQSLVVQQQHPTSNGSSQPRTHSNVHKVIQSSTPHATQADNTSKPASLGLTHDIPPSDHSRTNQLPATSSDHQIITSSSLTPTDYKSLSPLAPIAEVSEQSTTSLLDHADSSGAGVTRLGDTASTSDTSKVEDNKVSQVQRSSTLPSACKRPTPYRFNPTKYMSADIQEQSTESMSTEATFNTSSMKLSDFTALNTSVFPKHVRISNLFMSVSGDVFLTQGDLLDLQFVRQTKAVVLVSATAEEYVVPLNSANRFALVYDPLNTNQFINQGYHFKSVGELIAMTQMPKVVVATEAHCGSKPQSSVEAGEILVVCGVVKQPHGKVLKVISTTHGRKVLDERCTANFSTRSDDTILSLNDMFKASLQLPVQAIIYPPSGLQLPDSLTVTPVTLKRFCVIKSVIATPSPQEHSPASSVAPAVYDISLDLDIEVQECSELTDKQITEMRARTQYLYSTFEPAKVIPFHKHTAECSEQFTTQSALLTDINLKGKFLGMQLELPEWLGQIRISKSKQAVAQTPRESLSQPLLSQNVPESNSGQAQYFKHGAVSIEQRMVAMEKHCRRMDIKINTLIQSVTEVVKTLTVLKKQSKQQAGSETYQGHDQYVDMLNVEIPQPQPSGNQDSLPPPGFIDQLDTNSSEEPEAHQTAQQLVIADDQFAGVKEWQKKQEKHLQWQQEQVQHWQIECEKQMQEMQQKLTQLEDRQMKFFLETQQKVKEWKSSEPEKVADNAQHKYKEADDSKQDNLGIDQTLVIEKPKIPPKPSKEPPKNESKATTKGKGTDEDKTKIVQEDIDVGLDMIASWCSQMELELNELYTNSVESHQ